ncbi:MAG: HAMP domain-containing histidine kinase [Alphaproteobacteria bacterium]|nr:HAMP domain-containing histidine kinase [Alphaproteobacteria bacterium]
MRAGLFGSTSLRLALAFAGLFVASSLLLVGVLWWRTTAYLDREIDAVILADTRAVADRLRDFGLVGAIETVADRVAANRDAYAIYLLTDPGFRPVAGNLDGWPREAGREPGWYQAEMRRAGQERATRLLSVLLPGGFRLLIGRDVQDRAAVRAMIVNGLAWATGIALLLAVGGGLLVRRGLLRRVETINRTAAAIVQGDLGRRLPTRGSSDEFDQLERTINGMLEQIQQLIEGVRQVSNVLAHDLRTPIAELRARLEDLLATRPAGEAVFAGVERAVADIDRLIGLFNALLRLAELDAGVRRAGFRPLDPAGLVMQAAELYAAAAELKGVALTATAAPGTSVLGDPTLLAQAVANLVDNAVKYTPAGGRIVVALDRVEGAVRIAVADSGPGIAEPERARAVERFYRGDASRGTPGAGLGLSIVAAIARLHGGSLSLDDNRPGLAAALLLPQA